MYGAAQLNSGQLEGAIASLERALLLDANNGAALIDYASALYYSGELFAAIDLNEQLLARDDLPSNLKPMLEKRAALWQSKTYKEQREVGISVGYDSNINNATFIDSLTLNSTTGDIVLPINENEREDSAKYTNLSASYRQLSLDAFRQKRFSINATTRLSEHTDSNYLQITSNYQDRHLLEEGFWFWEAAASYVYYDNQSLSAAASIAVKKQWQFQQDCQPYVLTDVEYLKGLKQNEFDSISFYNGAGFNCQITDNHVEFQLGFVADQALNNNRAGKDRGIIRFDLQWQRPMFKGRLNTYFRHTRALDEEGYNPLLENNARRRVNRSDLFVEYSQPLSKETLVNLSFNKQLQQSNIPLFKQKGSKISLGFKKRF